LLLCIDIGNTNIVLGCYKGDELVFYSRMSSSKNRLGDQYAVDINDILSLYKVDKSQIHSAILSSVVPSVTKEIFMAVKLVLSITPMVVGPGIKTGLNIKIDDPGQLGSDMAVTAVAAKSKYPLPIIIVDMGTATTFSIIARNGDFLGGSILPGLSISTEALVEKTSLLTGISFEAPRSVIGTNTSDSMKSGAIFGTASMIEGMCHRYFQEIGDDATTIVTGGLAEIIAKHCRVEMIVDQLLLLEGLKIIYNKNI